MISDGEVLACLSGYPSLIAILDMIYILGTSTWPQDPDEFDGLFPEPDLRAYMQRLSRYLQDLF